MSGTLFLVPTPIGNLEDMTYRAVRMLNEVDHILTEDTRTSGKLLKHYGIATPMKPYHQHNEHTKTIGVMEQLKTGKHLALITDAGTPAISDPGFLLVRECVKHNIRVECLPGATALIPALAVSGLPNDRFIFEGFLPHKKGRNKRLTALQHADRTVVLYESPHRLLKTLQDLAQHCSMFHEISVSRELSKKFEETVRGTFEEVIAHFKQHPPKGEFVIVVNPILKQ
jgi:16S rRNA (cytidine1402-2'-O)-methyltransferase